MFCENTVANMEYMIFAKILANARHYFLVIQPILRIFSFFFVTNMLL